MESREHNDRAMYAKPWSKVLPWIILVGALALTFVVVRDRCSGQMDVNTPATTTIDIPGGVKLDAPAESAEARLASILASSENPGAVSFVLENVRFDSAGAMLPESRAQIDNIIAILTAYPDVDIQLIGHSDKTADQMADLRRSHHMATQVMNTLLVAGIDRNRANVLGYGSTNPLVPHASQSASRVNPRVELQVKK